MERKNERKCIFDGFEKFTYGDPNTQYSNQPYPNYDYYYQQNNQYYQQLEAYNNQQAVNPTNTYGSYDQQQDLAHWNYYGHYYPQQQQQQQPFQRPIKYNNKSVKNSANTFNNPAADTRPIILKSVQAIAQHESLHIKCPQCDFMCLKSFLEEHEEQYHGKPSTKKQSRPDGIVPPNAPKLDTPEQLAAWIAERKKNWPSQKNIERKAREEAEKMARGELPLKRKANSQQETNKRQAVSNKSNEEKDNNDDDDIMDPEKDAITSKDPSSIGKISLPEENKPKRRCIYFIKGRCNKGSKCTFLHERPITNGPKQVAVIRKRPNLLYKLLEKDIMQEKSVILQCFRYLVDNNFFGKEETTTATATTTATTATTTATTAATISDIDNNNHAAIPVEEEDDTKKHIEQLA
ncbi:hypothetical protein G6F68_006535 [Rhizopus microsporus]|nr:hypothetical protein G6F68_006535 [Rhizopus microsporus]